jgi:hypothetical protein
MVGWGIFLIVLGAGSLLLPMLGYQFTLMELLDDFQPYAGIVVAIIGAALVFMGMNRGSTSEATAEPSRPASTPDAEDPYRQP